MAMLDLHLKMNISAGKVKHGGWFYVLISGESIFSANTAKNYKFLTPLILSVCAGLYFESF